METTDGAWRVEIVKRRRTQWYKTVHDVNVLDWLSVAAVQRILSEGGINMADLGEAAA